MPADIIAVNLASYQSFQKGAYAHLQRLGVRYVEIGVPEGDQVADVQRELQSYDLSPSALVCPCDLGDADPQTMRPHLEAGRALGVPLFFISAKAGDLPKPEAYRRLRARAELADEYGITLALETHPDLAENATEARATLHAVGHPRLKWNLDTANLYYYNHNIDEVGEARQGADLIASVHLKDTNGAFQTWWFPALGEGIVDFAGVRRVLTALGGFHGPYTLELEGIQGENLDETAVQERVARSLRHLKQVGFDVS